jgi:hypothetical protein
MATNFGQMTKFRFVILQSFQLVMLHTIFPAKNFLQVQLSTYIYTD